MCWGVYGKVVKVEGDRAYVDFGGVVGEVISVVEDLSPGDYVIVHAGMAISKLSEEDFIDSIKLVREVARRLAEEGELSNEELTKVDEILKKWAKLEK